MLLLDEPTNHLDLAAIDWLEDWLGRYKGAFIVDQPRPHLPDPPDPRDAVARPRHAAAQGDRLRRLRGVEEDAGLCRGSPRRREARRQAEARGALARARRHRPAQAQPGAARQAVGNARAARGDDQAGTAPPSSRSTATTCRTKSVIAAEHVTKRFGERTIIQRLHPAHPARRPDRRGRRERRGQDHAAQAADRRDRSPTRARSRSPRRSTA